MIRRLFFVVALMLVTTVPVLAQEDDIDAAMKKAMENANKPASKADMKKLEQQAMAQMDQMETENKAEEEKQKAAAQAVVDAKGPTSFPDNFISGLDTAGPAIYAGWWARAQVSGRRTKSNPNRHVASFSRSLVRRMG